MGKIAFFFLIHAGIPTRMMQKPAKMVGEPYSTRNSMENARVSMAENDVFSFTDLKLGAFL